MSEVTQSAGQLEVFRHRLEAIAEQMGETLARTAYSANIKERRDHSCAVFDANGRLLAQAAHIPVHLGSMPASVAAALEMARPQAGDVILLNDPYAGGTHLPDVTVVSPVVWGERIVGFVANRAHHADIGGSVPGSMGVTTSIEQEGVRLGPTRWFQAGREDVAFRERFLGAVRGPVERLGDLRAQLAANEIGQRQMGGLFDRYGAIAFESLSAELMAYAERLVRATLASIPAGSYSAEDYLDGDGLTDARIRIAVRLDVSHDGILADFEGTSAQVAGCVNCPLAVTRSAVGYVIACLVGDRLPHNAGMFAPITVRAPRGCVVNAEYPAAVAAGNVETSQRIVDVVLRALSTAVPERIPAGAAGTMASISFGGVDPTTGREFTYYETVGGGMGAWSEGDGESAVHTHMTNTLNTPIEALESAFPVRAICYAIRRGSGGAGGQCGGDGIVREIEALVPLTASVLADRGRGGGGGLQRGGDGAALRVAVASRDGRVRELPSKATFELGVGDRLRIETPGGGGFGSI